MTDVPELLSILSEPVRLHALRFLWDGKEHCVCELMDVLGKSQSGTSRHLAALKRAGLVEDRRDAQWVRYRRHPKLGKATIMFIQALFNLETTMQKKRLP